jgi:hypothetical protein
MREGGIGSNRLRTTKLDDMIAEDFGVVCSKSTLRDLNKKCWRVLPRRFSVCNPIFT